MSQPVGTPARRSAKTLGSTKKPSARTTRATLHLSEQTVQRLGVHCSLVGRDRSKVADEILSTWLARFGRGREIFDSPGSVDTEDRQGEGGPVSDSGEQEAA